MTQEDRVERPEVPILKTRGDPERPLAVRSMSHEYIRMTQEDRVEGLEVPKY
jgi:hypothetical protein